MMGNNRPATPQTFQILPSPSRAQAWQLAAGFSSGLGHRNPCTHCSVCPCPHAAPPQLPECPAFWKSCSFCPGGAPRSSTAALAGSRARVGLSSQLQPRGQPSFDPAVTIFKINIPRAWIQAGWNGKGWKVLHCRNELFSSRILGSHFAKDWPQNLDLFFALSRNVTFL